MHDMNFSTVKSNLIKAGYSDNSVTDSTVNRLLALSGKSHEMLYDWIYRGVSPSFEPICGIDSDFLVNKLSMKAPALIMAYSMLEDEPEDNAIYFKKLANNIVGFYPDLKK